MEGCSGTSRIGKRVYFYYRCRGCGFRIPAEEIEKVVVARIGELARKPSLLTPLVEETNRRLTLELPEVESRLGAARKELSSVNAEAGAVMRNVGSLEGSQAAVFVREHLEELAKRRAALEVTLSELEVAADRIQRTAVNRDQVVAALARFKSAYAKLQPHQRRALIRLVIAQAEVSEGVLRLHFHGNPASEEIFEQIKREPGRNPSRLSEPSKWLRR